MPAEHPAKRARLVVLVFAAWVLTRVLLVALTRARGLYPYQDDPFDLATFPGWGHAFATGDGDVPLRDGPWEYPAGAAAVFVLPALLDGAPYQLGFVALMVLVDAAFLVLLLLHGLRHGRLAGAWLWVAAVPLLGPVALARYDVLPTLAAGAGLLLGAAAMPLGAGAVLAAGGALKLWPLLLLPLVAVLLPGRVRLVAGATAVLGAVAGITTLYGGGPQLLSFLSYQRERGLEIESLPALPLLVAGKDVQVFFGFGSNQISGRHDALLEHVATAGLVGVLLLVGLLAVRARRTGADAVQALLALAVLLVAGLLCFDKVLSAQYPLWLAGLFAVGLCFPRSRLLPAVPLLAGVLVTTQLLYPLLIQDLVAVHDRAVAVAVVRDVLLLALTVQLGVLAWRSTGSEQRVAADEHRAEDRHAHGAGDEHGLVRAEALGQAGQRPHGREDDQVDPR
ncbi:MAG: glycosyltransferase 87 family protein [Actinobacteria bacterium]|nr:glycosyltransferase 87 family protein [Actinomycetota bacterium]MCA1720487.1 glycosyltransferase 87 family protein [Actinomycetota bacterium]